MIEEGHPEEEVEKMRRGMEEEEGWVENSLLPPRCTLLNPHTGQQYLVYVEYPIYGYT